MQSRSNGWLWKILFASMVWTTNPVSAQQNIDPNRLSPELRGALVARGLTPLLPLQADPNDAASIRSQFQTRVLGDEPVGVLVVQLSEASQLRYSELKVALETLGAVVGPYVSSIGRFEAEGPVLS